MVGSNFRVMRHTHVHKMIILCMFILLNNRAGSPLHEVVTEKKTREMEKSSLPLNDCETKKTHTIINRLHTFTHGGALVALFYYRITTISSLPQTNPILPHILIFIAELVLSFLWLLCQASNWKPVARTAYPDRLPGDENLPAIDVFICTTDPNKEPSLDVMNTVISAMALDYPPHKLHVYISDDGGSTVTLRAVKQAWEFSKMWIPFCRRYKVRNRCPEAYLFREEDNNEDKVDRSGRFAAERKEIEKAYEDFTCCLSKIFAETGDRVSRDHPPIIEVIGDDSSNDQELPLLVYVAREKRPSYPHNFKAGALNVLFRVSAMISNSPYVLVLDCDMYCNDTTSARQAMCFHLDPKLGPDLGFVQFPQRFYSISRNDIYDGAMRFIWHKWLGMDGFRGPVLSGTGFYLKREAIYGTRKFQQDVDLNQLKKCYGTSSEFIKSIYRNYRPQYPNNRILADQELQKELQLLASCSYDNGTEWGKEVGFRYFAVVEDYFTGLHLHCEGWRSVYVEPPRPCFLGSSPITLGEVLAQNTRWFLGLSQIALSKFSPLIYCSLRMSILQSMIYAELSLYAFYFLPIYILAIVPQLCLLSHIPLYPQVSSPYFLVFSFLFLSSQLKHVQEVLISGHSIRTWQNEQRIWMIKSLTSFFYAALNTIMEKIDVLKASFVPTNKAMDDQVSKLYDTGKYNYRAPSAFMVPLCSLYMLNLVALVVGFGRIVHRGKGDEMLMQAFVPLFGLLLHWPLLEGMVLRKDKGRVSSSVSLVSALVSSVVSACAALAF